MINLRYHIVSIVAVFLALGIGVALGSSFVDGFVVDTLRRNVDTLEADRADLRDEVQSLQDEIDANQNALDEALDAVLPVTAVGRLGGTPVMIIASDGVSTAAWEQVRDMIVATDATYEGTLWLTDRLDMSDAQNRAELASTFDLVNDSESLVRPAVMVRLETALFPPGDDAPASVLGGVAGDVADELLEGGVDAATSELAGVLVALRDDGFIRHDTEFASTGALEEVPAAGTVFVVVSSSDAVLDHDELLYPLLERGVALDAGNHFVAVEPVGTDDLAPAVAFVGPIRADTELRRQIATIDSVDTFEGLLALLAVTDGDEIVHLGLSASATSRLPSP